MEQAIKFNSSEEIANWLEEQRPRPSDQLCVRAAMRCLPNLALNDPSKLQETDLFCLWASLHLVCSTYMPNREIVQQLPLNWIRTYDKVPSLIEPRNWVTRAYIQTVLATNSAAEFTQNRARAISEAMLVSSRTGLNIEPLLETGKSRSYAQFESDVRLFENGHDLRASSLWDDGLISTSATSLRDQFAESLKRFPQTQFWFRFFEGMSKGTFTEWDLAFEVVEFAEADWEMGSNHIGKLIAEIEKRMANAPLDQDALAAHLGTIVQFPQVHRDFAEGTGLQIATAIATFKAEAPANCLPDGFQCYEVLPARFDNIAKAMDLDGDKDAIIAALKKEVTSLHETINQLQQDLSDARLALADQRLDAVEAAQIRTFGEKTQTHLTNITLFGAFAMGMLTFFGVDEEKLRYDALKSELEALAQEMKDAQETVDEPMAP